MNNLLITFLFGGLIVSSVSYVSDFVSNTVAALLWAFPFSIIPTIYYFHLENKSEHHIYEFLKKSIYSIIFLCLNMFLLYYTYKKTRSLFKSVGIVLIFYLTCFYLVLKNDYLN